jgi:PqqD family protein of HPr-rel-A system
VPSQPLRIQAWADDDAAVVYNTLSGETHLIESLGGELLRLIEARPRTSDALATELVALFSDADHAQIVQYIEATLVQLQAIGLVHATAL